MGETPPNRPLMRWEWARLADEVIEREAEEERERIEERKRLTGLDRQSGELTMCRPLGELTMIETAGEDDEIRDR